MFKRILSILMIVTIMSLSLIGRVGYISLSNNYNAEIGYNSYCLNISKLYTNFYYNNGIKINNNVNKFAAIIEPNEKCIGELESLFDYQDRISIISELKNGFPIVKETDAYKKLNHIKIKEIKGSFNTCSQLINKESKGLLYYCPDEIGLLKMIYNIDAMGHILNGESKFINNNYDSKFGYLLTLDNKIQQITYNACENLDNGCAVVMDIKNFDILSCVTKPDNCYLNKPFLQYSPGSVFKIVVAMAAIENGIDFNYNCIGNTTIGDTEFSCQNEKEHGKQNLKTALANSCNCYFVNLALLLGPDKILDTAKKLGFYDVTNLFFDFTFKNSKLPTRNELNMKGELALFGFGQGKVTVSPIQMANALCIIANKGNKGNINLVNGRVDEKGNVYDKYVQKYVSKIDYESCEKMIDYMSYVVTDGTGKNAQSNDYKSAGKTATAQTGQFKDGIEKLNTWFVGIYPNDNPKYAIVIMKEDGTSGSKDCCPIFSTIVDNIPQ